jgi:CRISPR-associated endonuclease/helicase Cas3
MAQAWLEDLGDEPLSQCDLAEAWERMQDASSPPPRWQSAWLDYGPATPVLELRDGSPTLTVVLEEDWPRLKDPNNKTDLAEVALPMPVRPGDDWQLKQNDKAVDFNGVPIAKMESVAYDPRRGGEWL